MNFASLTYHFCRPHRKGHGIHSPFVYALIREVFVPAKARFRNSRGVPEFLPELEALWQKYASDRLPEKYLFLLQVLVAHFDVKSVSYNAADGQRKHPQLALVDAAFLAQNVPDNADFEADDLLVIVSPNPSVWELVRAKQLGTVVIDLHRVGLLFFRERLTKESFRIYY
jgi:hypothetical protein